MAEITSDVYDIFHPTPVPLKELSAIVISLEIWRCKVMKYRSTSDDDTSTLETFDPTSENISLETVLPDLPSLIYDQIGKYVTKFSSSLGYWLQSHHERVFNFHYNHRNHALKHFDDFVCDHDGVIHYVRTAERMMHCDQFLLLQKFIIACTYCFEDDIRRLWPSVSSNVDLNKIYFSKTPQLYYWICCLRNELDKIPLPETNDTVDEVMLIAYIPRNIQSLEYFWSRIPSENRKRNAVKLLERVDDLPSFIRVILLKLHEQELDEFINERSYDLMFALFSEFSYVWYDKELILTTWMQICRKVNENAYTNLVRKILLTENRELEMMSDFKKASDGDEDCIEEWCHFCCVMWNNTPEKLKRTAVNEITSNNNLFSGLFMRSCIIPAEPKEFEFLSTFLSCASSQERRTFWYDYWCYFIYNTGCKDFRKIMTLCLENEDAIIDFGTNVLANQGYYRDICGLYMRSAHFADVNDFVSIACHQVHAARNFKQQLLQSAFLDERVSVITVSSLIGKAMEFDEFIYDAYNNNIDLVENFKNQLVDSFPIHQEYLFTYAGDDSFGEFMQFIDAFVNNEQILVQIKTRLIECVKRVRSIHNYKFFNPSAFGSLLLWCLGSEEEAAKFKLEYLDDDV